jgi:8-oxo-dGTP pyrophosphatase MutT (NUDIX family)
MTFRPDLVGCWIFRVTPEQGLEILLIRRAASRIYPGVWQCVTGGLEGEEKVVDGALRELEEETGFTTDDLEALYGLDQVNLFHADHLDALMAEAVFAARVRPGREPRLSHEHDAFRWLSPDDAREAVDRRSPSWSGSTPIPSTHPGSWQAPGRSRPEADPVDSAE